LEASQAVGAPLTVRVEQHLGVRMGAERVARRGELGAQRRDVVDLAVVDNHAAPVARQEGLVRRLAEIEDAQADVTEPEVPASGLPVPLTRGVRAAMPDRGE